MIQFDLQLFGGLFGGGGGGETQVIEKPVVQQAAPAAVSSSVQQASATDTEKAERRKKWGADVRGRRSTITGAGNNGALTAASSIAKTLLGEMPQRKTLGGA